MKTAFVFVFRRCLQEYIPLSHTSSRRFQVAIKKSSRNLAKTSWRRLQKIFRTSCKDIFKTFCKDIFKTFSRRFQDVFKTSSRCLQDVPSSSTGLVNTSSRRFQDVFNAFWKDEKTYWKDDYLQKDLLRPHTWEIYGQSTNFPRAKSLDMPGLLRTVFLTHFMKWRLLQPKIFSLKLGFRKDFSVSVNTESMNERIPKNVFLRFYLFTLQHHLVDDYRNVFRTQSYTYNGDFLRK